MNTTNSLNFVFLVGLLAATIGLLPLMNSYNALAQTNATSSTSPTNMTGGENMTMQIDGYAKPMMDKEHKMYEKINGTLNVMETMYQAIGDKFNVTLSDAIATAEQSVGNDSQAMSANGEMKDGFMVISVVLGSPDMKFTKVLIDPGTGTVLQTNPISMMEWMSMMHPQGHDDKKMKGMHSGSSGGSQGYGGEQGMGMEMRGMHSGGGGGSQGSGW
jgi:uncharacterized membrane protein YgcG